MWPERTVGGRVMFSCGFCNLLFWEGGHSRVPTKGVSWRPGLPGPREEVGTRDSRISALSSCSEQAKILNRSSENLWRVRHAHILT